MERSPMFEAPDSACFHHTMFYITADASLIISVIDSRFRSWCQLANLRFFSFELLPIHENTRSMGSYNVNSKRTSGYIFLIENPILLKASAEASALKIKPLFWKLIVVCKEHQISVALKSWYHSECDCELTFSYVVQKSYPKKKPGSLMQDKFIMPRHAKHEEIELTQVRCAQSQSALHQDMPGQCGHASPSPIRISSTDPYSQLEIWEQCRFAGVNHQGTLSLVDRMRGKKSTTNKSRSRCGVGKLCLFVGSRKFLAS